MKMQPFTKVPMPTVGLALSLTKRAREGVPMLKCFMALCIARGDHELGQGGPQLWFPATVSYLSDQAFLTRSTVCSSLAQLQALGILRLVRRGPDRSERPDSEPVPHGDSSSSVPDEPDAEGAASEGGLKEVARKRRKWPKKVIERRTSCYELLGSSDQFAPFPWMHLMHRKSLEHFRMHSHPNYAALRMWLVLMKLRNRKNGLSFISYENLASGYGISKGIIRSCISMLTEAGVIHTFSDHSDGPLRLPNAYFIQGLKRVPGQEFVREHRLRR